MSKSEAEKFFDSLPSEEGNNEEFSFFEKPSAEKPTPEKEEAPVVTTPEKDKDDDEQQQRRMNRRERRDQENNFWKQQLEAERQSRERLETELLRQRNSEKQTEEVDSRLTRLFGDTPQGKEASRIVQELLHETREQAQAPYADLEKQRQAETEAEARFTEEIEDGIATVEDEYGIDLTSRSARQMRSDFLDFVDELSPEDSFVNFEKAWPLFQASQKATASPEEIARKKQIAGRSSPRGSAQRPDTSKLQPVSFEQVDNIFSRMFRK
jgi:hypothetical protein